MKAIAEAPSKAIVTGEHFVVHGAWALAAALPRKVKVEVAESTHQRVISNGVLVSDRQRLRPIGRILEAMAKEYSLDSDMTVSITSEIPEGAGLGSSASTMVAVTSAVARLRGISVGVAEISKFAMVGETEIHGRPSGVDVAICSIGGVVLFKRGSSPRRITLNGTKSLIVAFSGCKRSTRRQIRRVSGTKELFPSLFEGLTEAASEVSLMAAERLSAGDLEGLGRMLSLNHAVLSAIGVSSPQLDRLVDLALSLGAYGAKLTGAGGGGSIVAVAPGGKEKSVVSGLRDRGFEAFLAKIPAGGVRSWLEK